ncbi:hypothetical protein HDU82_006583 [Entophlyctis luteolus]|nr:hypothetical protein HDU82_006583 [Entophlyctis luteolus]
MALLKASGLKCGDLVSGIKQSLKTYRAICWGILESAPNSPLLLKTPEATGSVNKGAQPFMGGLDATKGGVDLPPLSSNNEEFDAFVIAAAYYIRWFVQVLHCQKTKVTMGEPDVDEGDPKNLSATRGVKSLFADDDEEEPMSAEKAISNKDKYLKELAMAYCFLLLITSRESIEPAKERKSFEVTCNWFEFCAE